MRVVLRIAGALLLVACVCVLLPWTVGRIASDRWIWSQYLSWIPTILVAPTALLLWLTGAVMCNFGSFGRAKRRPIVLIIGAWSIAACGYLAIIECRLYRLPLLPRPSGSHIRILNWNVTAVERLEQITGPVQTQNPDIAILVNPHSHVGWSQVPAAFGSDYKFLNVGGIVILSRVPVIRHGMAWLGIEGLPPETQAIIKKRRGWTDPGRAMFVELDTTAALGGTTTIWVLDMPSEPRFSRWSLAQHAAKVIREWNGVASVIGPGGALVSTEPLRGFPTPDLALGDFNIPRGSASLNELLPGMHNAFDLAGAGYPGTWPRYGYKTPIPLLQVDQMFIREPLAAARYEVIDPGFGYHQMQVADLVKAP